MSHADPILLALESILGAVDRGDLDEAQARVLHLDVEPARELRRAKLRAVAGTPRGRAVERSLRSRRAAVSASIKRQVFMRDQYTCRLCGMQTVDLDVLKAISRIFPREFPYHAAWRHDIVSPVYWTHSTSLEHVIPIARGGSDHVSNFVTSCYGCNDARVDYLLEELRWVVQPIARVAWNGFRNYLPALSGGAAGARSR